MRISSDDGLKDLWRALCVFFFRLEIKTPQNYFFILEIKTPQDSFSAESIERLEDPLAVAEPPMQSWIREVVRGVGPDQIVVGQPVGIVDDQTSFLSLAPGEHFTNVFIRERRRRGTGNYRIGRDPTCPVNYETSNSVRDLKKETRENKNQRAKSAFNSKVPKKIVDDFRRT